MNVTELSPLFDSGLYSQLVKAGLISYRLSTYRDYYLYVDALMKTQGLTKTKATKEAALKFQCSESNVWKAIRLFSDI